MAEGKVEKEQTEDEFIADRMKNASGCIMCIPHPNSSGYRSNGIVGEKFPQFLVDEWREEFRKDKAEMERQERLTPAQKDEELRKLVNEASKFKGFMAFQVPVGGKEKLQG